MYVYINFQLILLLFMSLQTCFSSRPAIGASQDHPQLMVLLEGRNATTTIRLNEVARSDEEFQTYWNRVGLQSEQPTVDFSKVQVLFFALGTVTKGGHRLKVSEVSNSTTVESLQLLHEIPGGSCLTASVEESPFLIMSLPLTASKPELVTLEEFYNCE